MTGDTAMPICCAIHRGTRCIGGFGAVAPPAYCFGATLIMSGVLPRALTCMTARASRWLGRWQRKCRTIHPDCYRGSRLNYSNHDTNTMIGSLSGTGISFRCLEEWVIILIRRLRFGKENSSAASVQKQPLLWSKPFTAQARFCHVLSHTHIRTICFRRREVGWRNNG